MSARVTYEQLRAMARKPAKYGNRKSGGYASAREQGRAAELRMLERCGEISELREQVRFVLIPAQRDARGRLAERQCAYVADFVYRAKGGELVVEDCKGFRTPEYVIKRKLMLKVHGIRIKET